jgi:NAD(P)-dependent dehydrogenase (short-subunit alcohol dehydrogenase family)
MSGAGVGSPVFGEQDVSGKAVLVTGGTTGIGREVVRLLASRGARVLFFGRDEHALSAALADLSEGGGAVQGIAADVSRLEDVRRVFSELDDRFGGVDILVNNAAVTGEGFEQDSLEEIEYVIRTNVVGYIACAQQAVQRMRRGGHVVLVGSMSADVREPDAGTYVATKGAIQAFSESLRKKVNERGIRVTLIEPGKVATDMVEQSAASKEQAISEGRMLRPEDVAGTILWALIQPARCDIVSLQIRPIRQVI